jgi:hypothetical protein
MSKHCAPLASLTLGDPLAELLARKIIEVAQIGIREAADISARAIKEIDIHT